MQSSSEHSVSMTPRGTAWSKCAALPAAVLSLAGLVCAGTPAAGGSSSAAAGVRLAAAGTTTSRSSISERFRYSASSPDFEIRSEQRMPLEPLLDVAETTLWRTRDWLGVTNPARGIPTLIYLTDADDSLSLVEREHGLVPTESLGGGGDPRDTFHGRCFPESGVIVIPSAVGALRWQIAHEVTHLVFHEIVGRNVEILNEGLAEIVPYWILSGATGGPETLDASYELYDNRLSRAVLAREVPTFEAFLDVDEQTFYDDRAQWLWYALSWKLAKVLVENRDPLAHGRLRRFLDLVGAGTPVEPALRAVYDERAVRDAWQAAVAKPAAWRPMFGDWRADPYGMSGTVGGAHSACVVSAESLFAGESFTLEVTLDSPAGDAGFGFAFDVGSEDAFAYLEFRPACGRVALAEHALGRWVRIEDYALEPAARAALFAVQRGQRLTLRAAGRGQLDVLVNNTPVFRFDLGRPLRGGSAGLMFENCDAGASDRDLLEMRFRGATLTR